jgi:hypothetical protein
MLKELFVGRTVYFEPGKIMNGFNLIVDLVRSMVPSTDSVWLLVVDNRSGLTELAIHGGDVAAGPTAIAF